MPDMEQLNRLFSVYSSEKLIDATRNKAAFANDVYELTTSGGQKYVMRILKAQSPDICEREAVMQTKLLAAGITTPQYLSFPNGGHVGEKDGVHFTLSKYIGGVAPSSASLGLVNDLGAMLAKLHDCFGSMQIPWSAMQWFDPKNAMNDLGSYEGAFKARLAALIGKHEQLFGLELPKSVIHGDFWLGNVFAERDKVTAVFDWETAEYSYRIIDLARTYTSLRRETQFPPRTIINALFEGYDSAAKQSLTREEHKNFGLVIAYVAGVCALWHAVHARKYIEYYLEQGEEALQSNF